MSGGAYSALSGMQTRLEELDRLAADLANIGTSGYKTERSAKSSAEREAFAAALDSAVDVVSSGTKVDFRGGTLAGTGRDLDAAIDGHGFFVIETDMGTRYTRDGGFVRRADGLLTTADGHPVAGEGGEIRLGPGQVSIAPDGTVRAGDAIAGRLKLAAFASEADLVRESGARFRAIPGATPIAPTGSTVVGGSLEQSNVSAVDRMVALTEISRSFEALQRGVSVLMNDVDGRAIAELGRRLDERNSFAGIRGGQAGSRAGPSRRPVGKSASPRGTSTERRVIRALYTAASGMNAQQANIDNVAHNLANVNTTGFKKSRMEFEDLVYQQIKAPGTPTSQEAEAPIGLEAGLGARAVATARNFSAGNMRSTNGPLDLAIEGNGFFQVALPGGETGYTRAGALHLNGEGQVVTADGFALEPQISVPANAVSLSISKDGIVSVALPGQGAPQQIGTIELAMFQNPAGLQARGGNTFVATTASGDPTTGVPGTDGLGTIAQGFLEDSNVSVVEEMVNMILGQRAYEANSRVIRAADEMLQQVNNLSR